MSTTKKFISLDELSRYDGKIKELVSAKQDTLVSGTNIKTINDTSLLGSGNITTFSGNYLDLENKPIKVYEIDTGHISTLSTEMKAVFLNVLKDLDNGIYVVLTDYAASNRCYHVFLASYQHISSGKIAYGFKSIHPNRAKQSGTITTVTYYEIYARFNSNKTDIEYLELRTDNTRSFTILDEAGVAQYALTKNNTTSYTPSGDYNPSTKKYVDDSLSGKQDALVSGTNIKTINNTSLLGSGNISIDVDYDLITTSDIDTILNPPTPTIDLRTYTFSGNQGDKTDLTEATTLYPMLDEGGYDLIVIDTNGTSHTGTTTNKWTEFPDAAGYFYETDGDFDLQINANQSTGYLVVSILS